MIGELILKWIVPFVLSGLAAFGAYILARPKSDISRGIQMRKQEQWESIARKSKVHEELCGAMFDKLKKESEEMDKTILTEIEQMSQQLKQMDTSWSRKFEDVNKDLEIMKDGILDAHLQNLIASCKIYIQRGYITPAELEAYNERLATYHRLGGNGHMDPWDDRIQRLPCHD